MSDDAQSLILAVPPDQFYTVWGQINYCWAKLEVIVTGALCAVMDVDSVEVGVVVGRLEAEAKLHKIRKILLHRKEVPLANKVKALYERLEKIRPVRNAITHGYYLGCTDHQEIFYSLPSEFLIDGDDESANPLFIVTFEELTSHPSEVLSVAMELLELFKGERLDALTSLPVRAPSYKNPKNQPPPKDKKSK